MSIPQITPRAAQRLAERTHTGTLDRYGAPLIAHVRRVAAAVPPEARTVAWLHETLECAALRAEDLRAAGASEDEIRAVELLTRDAGIDAAAYSEHIATIADAPGRAGELAVS